MDVIRCGNCGTDLLGMEKNSTRMVRTQCNGCLKTWLIRIFGMTWTAEEVKDSHTS